VFSESVGRIVSLIKPAIDALTALTGYGIFGLGVKHRPVSEAMADFIQDLYLLIDQIKELSQDFEAKGIEAAGAFSENAKKMVDLVKSATEALGGIAEFSTEYIQPGKIATMMEIISYILDWIVWLAYVKGGPWVEAAVTFSEQMKTVFDAMKTALDFLNELGTSVMPDEAKINSFFAAIERVQAQFSRGVTDSRNILDSSMQIASNLYAAQKIAASGIGISRDSGGFSEEDDSDVFDVKGIPTMPPIDFSWPVWPGAPVVGGGGGGSDGQADRRDALLSDIRDTGLNTLDVLLYLSENVMGSDIWELMDRYTGSQVRRRGSFFGGRRVINT
jgi:hypothetical protein